MIQDREQLKQWFKRYMYPTQQQFWDWIDSFWHKNEAIPAASIEGLQEVVDGVVEGVLDAISIEGSGHVIANNGTLELEDPEKSTKYFADYWGNEGSEWLKEAPGSLFLRQRDLTAGTTYDFLKINTDSNLNQNSAGLILNQTNEGSPHQPALLVDTNSPRFEYKYWDSYYNRSASIMDLYSGRIAFYYNDSGNSYETFAAHNGSAYFKNYGNQTFQINEGNIQAFSSNNTYLQINPGNLQLRTNNGNNIFLVQNDGYSNSLSLRDAIELECFRAGEYDIQGFYNGNKYFGASPGGIAGYYYDHNTGNNNQFFNAYTGGIYLNDENGSSIFYASKWGINGFGSNGSQFCYIAPNYLSIKNDNGSDFLNVNNLEGLTLRIADGGLNNGQPYCTIEPDFNSTLKLYGYDTNGVKMLSFQAGNGQVQSYVDNMFFFGVRPSDFELTDGSGNMNFQINSQVMNFLNPENGKNRFSANPGGISAYDGNSDNSFFHVSWDGYLYLRDSGGNERFTVGSGMSLRNTSTGGNAFYANIGQLTLYDYYGNIQLNAANGEFWLAEQGNANKTFYHTPYSDGSVPTGVTRTKYPFIFGSTKCSAPVDDGQMTLFLDGTDLKVQANIGGVPHSLTLGALAAA